MVNGIKTCIDTVNRIIEREKVNTSKQTSERAF